MNLNHECSIYQIYFAKDQLAYLDKAFIPYNNAQSNPEYREYAVFKKNYDLKFHKNSQLTGMVSWKFNQKTGITGKNFLDFIQTNPGFDVYFINPFPHENIFPSVWEQAEHYHPGIIDLTQHIFNEIPYKINLKEIINLSHTAAYCNFWVGSEFFWEKYMAFTLPFYEYITNKASGSLRKLLFSRADKVIDASYFPFMIERLFSTLLYLHNDIKYIKYEYNEQDLIKKYNPAWVNFLMGLNYLDHSKNQEAREFFSRNMKNTIPFPKKKPLIIRIVNKLKKSIIS